jgi:hypothetical protein
VNLYFNSFNRLNCLNGLNSSLTRGIKMQFWATYCKVLGYVWLVATGLLILVGISNVWMKEGLSGVQELLSPSNAVNYIAMAIAVIPGIVLLKLSENFRSKIKTKQ